MLIVSKIIYEEIVIRYVLKSSAKIDIFCALSEYCHFNMRFETTITGRKLAFLHRKKKILLTDSKDIKVTALVALYQMLS